MDISQFFADLYFKVEKIMDKIADKFLEWFIWGKRK
jgi:hypothetical protein